MSESSGTSNSADGTLVVSNTRRSKVWKHFEPNLVFVDEIPKAVCLYCGLKLTNTHSSGTSSLINHISVSCPKIAEEDRKKFIGSLKKKQSVLGFVFDPKKSRELLAKFCIHAEVAFRKFEDPYFQKWVESMQPTFNTHGRQTIRNDCFETYEEMKKQLQGALESLDSRICLTSDMWTSNQKLGYMCVTAHYIDAKFNLNKKILSFKVVKYPHTSLAIAEALSRSLADWGIKRKLFTLTLDNASNNTAAVACFKENQDHGLLRGGRDFHIRCCAHILNILVQDGLLIIRDGIAKIRDLYRHINSSPSRIQAFNGIAITFDLPEKAGLAIDTSNRWDSTFTMLQEALTYRTVLNSYASDSNEVAAPSDEEWTAAEGIGAFLKAFAEATKIVSADRKPTTHLFLQVVLCIRRALKDWHWQTSEYVKGMARAMSVKFDKYWKESELNHALIIATILDPTRNLDYLDFFYEKNCDHVDDIERNVESAKDVMKLYFQQYASQVKRSNEPSITHDARINMGSPVLGKRELDDEFVQYRSRRKAFREPKSELDTYWEEHVETSDKNWNILAWWKANAEKYPVLSAMARDFLAVPLSTVSSESAFSCGGRILGDYRSSMKPEMVEALVCSKDWLTELPENEVGAVFKERL